MNSYFRYLVRKIKRALPLGISQKAILCDWWQGTFKNTSHRLMGSLRNKVPQFRGYIWFLVLALSVVNCKKPIKNKEYFPHHNGDWWKYQVLNTPGHLIREFGKTTQSGNITYQNWIKTSYDTLNRQISQEINYVLVSDTMVLFYEDLDEDPWIYLKFPLGVDSSWTFYIDEELVVARVISLEESWTVPAGEFKDVYQISYENREAEESKLIYYAPGVGIIKYSEYSDSELDSDEELLDYKVK